MLDDFDYNRPAVQIMLDLIFISNGVRFDDDEVVVGTPQPLDQRPDLYWDPNTFVRVTVPDTVDARYEGETGFMYRRMTLRDLPLEEGKLPLPVPPFPFYTSDVLDDINAYYGTQVTIDDIEDQEYVDSTSGLPIVFKSSSLIWMGTEKLTEGIYSPLIRKPNLSGFKEYSVVAP